MLVTGYTKDRFFTICPLWRANRISNGRNNVCYTELG